MASWEERFDATCDEIMELLRNRLVTRTAPTESSIFDGKEVKRWIHWVEYHSLRLNLSDEQKLASARTCIKGEAKDFVRRQEWISPFRSWNEMKNELVIRFGNEDDPDKIRLLLERDRRSQDFLDNYDARKLREKRDTEVNISHSEPCRSSRSAGYGVVKVADQGNLVHVFSMPERLLTNDCLSEANKATEVMLHNELLPASDHEACLGGKDAQREEETLVPKAPTDLVTNHVGEHLLGSEPTSTGCEELMGLTNTEKKGAQELNREALSETDVTEYAYQVFDQMSLEGKKLTKKIKKTKRLPKVKRCKYKYEKMHIRPQQFKKESKPERMSKTKMDFENTRIKRELEFAQMLKGRKRVFKQLDKWETHKSMQRKMPKSWTFKYKSQLLQCHRRAMKQKKHSVKIDLLQRRNVPKNWWFKFKKKRCTTPILQPVCAQHRCAHRSRGVLAMQNTLNDWQRMPENINSYVDNGGCCTRFENMLVADVLSLSYADLPPHFKQCYIYFVPYREDSEVHVGRVTPVHHTDAGKTVEDIGNDYREELVTKRIVMIGKRDIVPSAVMTCRIYELLSELCFQRAEHERTCFMHVIASMLDVLFLQLERFHGVQSFSSDLGFLRGWHCGFMDDLFGVLEKLPHLTILPLFRSGRIMQRPALQNISFDKTWAKGVFVYRLHGMFQILTALIWGTCEAFHQPYEGSFTGNVAMETRSQALQDFIIQQKRLQVVSLLLVKTGLMRFSLQWTATLNDNYNLLLQTISSLSIVLVMSEVLWQWFCLELQSQPRSFEFSEKLRVKEFRDATVTHGHIHIMYVASLIAYRGVWLGQNKIDQFQVKHKWRYKFWHFHLVLVVKALSIQLEGKLVLRRRGIDKP